MVASLLVFLINFPFVVTNEAKHFDITNTSDIIGTNTKTNWVRDSTGSLYLSLCLASKYVLDFYMCTWGQILFNYGGLQLNFVCYYSCFYFLIGLSILNLFHTNVIDSIYGFFFLLICHTILTPFRISFHIFKK